MVKVIATRLIGTTCTVWSAWETPYADHHSLCTVDGVLFGLIGSRPLPEAIRAMPASAERVAAADAFYQEQYLEAYRLIFAEHPELRDLPYTSLTYAMGEIEVWIGKN